VLRRNILGASIVAGIAVLAIPAQAQVATDDEVRLLRGEVVAHIVQERGPGGRLVAAIDIPAAPSVVWSVMLDCARAPAYVPGLDSCRIVEAATDGSSDVREHRIRWIALLPLLTLRFRSDYVAEREIRVTRVGGDLAAMQGAWRLEPRNGGRATRLHYDFRIVPSTLLPSGLVRAGLLRDTPKVLEAVRQEVARVEAR
jgi:hypothetical protein